jgi:hypothetical protein
MSVAGVSLLAYVFFFISYAAAPAGASLYDELAGWRVVARRDLGCFVC